jgi:dihydropteroate synthase
VTAEEESARVVPVIQALAARLRVPISVDTTKAVVARRALEAGASIVNDISGLAYDQALAGVAASSGAALILMHTRGRPQAMYAEAAYGDLVSDVAAELRSAMARATEAGVPVRQIVLDPGLGFAKHAAHSYGVLARLPELQAALDRPLLVGPSRKSFLRQAIGDRPPAERDWGTAAAVTSAVLAGAHLVRVHAVADMVQVVRVADAIRAAGEERVAVPGTDA